MKKDVVRIKGLLRTSNNGVLKKLLNPTLRFRNPDSSIMLSLRKIGQGVGLDDSEIHSATGYYTGVFSRFCSRLILLTILTFFIFVALAGLANNDGMLDYFLPSNSTYLPGTRYASIKPDDFK
ncbi:MAG: hypothetical protein P1Q69_08395 [Candidatus Thorarchaeota archaeon]|nr:hypothetical protein [Candidatus Thorarchaeota archaeon]